MAKEVAKKKEIKNKDTKKKTEKSKKSKHDFNIFKAIKEYFKSIMVEMKKVRWPNGNSMVKYSIATVVMVIFFCIVFYLIDLIIVGLKMVI